MSYKNYVVYRNIKSFSLFLLLKQMHLN